MAAPVIRKSVDKETKYDRQLRLWGDHGQSALENAKICLINATATGTEILKNLILPGIGSFTIIDANKVKGEDVGNNFFLTQDSIGKSRAHVATELLLELNADVSGNAVEESPEQILENNPDFFKSFTIVVVTDLVERTLLDLSSILYSADVPLLVCRSYGMIGYMRLAVKEHTVIESHPDNAHEDLRLDRPFPKLIEYANSLDLEAMTKQEHMHTPYLILLYKFLEKWKETHDGQIPKNYKEKKSFKELLRSSIRINEHGAPEDEENFDEAISAVNTALIPTKIPSDVQKILDDQACTNLSSESSPFWIMAQALKQFVENEGNAMLPLRGSIPDMTADSKRYIQLQNIYKEQSRKDCIAVTSRVQQILVSLGKVSDSIQDKEIKLFCKNSAFLRVIRCRSLAEEHSADTAAVQEISMNLENPDSEIAWYIMLRAADRFYSQYSYFPGSYDDQVDSDAVKLKVRPCSI
ncbi:NEDD8-activating enzyme E1 regulatory subunit-like [Anneissia japonica]|uniref:NEDD8-activating enzyme E1 regulatory subunit-like n=1 Tax=Anneissia japonica TaxID=1529436 RepID=UPI00142595B4|nr:NEDD8-activating enzyme E1 regulatory subunit-like [Anneissia japonica]